MRRASVLPVLLLLVGCGNGLGPANDLSGTWAATYPFPGSSLVLNLRLAAAIVKIRIGNGVIQQIFLGRKVLAQKPLAELAGVSLGRVAAVVLHFRDGSRMRLFGAPLWERERQCRDLQRLAPHLRPRESSGSGRTSA